VFVCGKAAAQGMHNYKLSPRVADGEKNGFAFFHRKQRMRIKPIPNVTYVIVT